MYVYIYMHTFCKKIAKNCSIYLALQEAGKAVKIDISKLQHPFAKWKSTPVRIVRKSSNLAV
jgi:hypothetical protein